MHLQSGSDALALFIIGIVRAIFLGGCFSLCLSLLEHVHEADYQESCQYNCNENACYDGNPYPVYGIFFKGGFDELRLHGFVHHP